MAYPEAAWERAMTVQEVILKALSGELHWFRAADILGGRHGRCGGGGSGMRSTDISAWWINDGIRRRSGAWRRPRSRGCCGSIGSGIAASMCGTFIRLRGGSTA